LWRARPSCGCNLSLSSHHAAGRFCRRSSGAKRAETSASVRSRAELVAPANSASASAALPVGPLPKPVAPCERDKDGGSANLCSRRTDLTCSTVSLVCDCHCRRRREVNPTYSSPRPGTELSVSHTYRGNAHSDFGAGADTEQPCSATPSSMPVLVWASVGLGQCWFGPVLVWASVGLAVAGRGRDRATSLALARTWAGDPVMLFSGIQPGRCRLQHQVLLNGPTSLGSRGSGCRGPHCGVAR